MTNFFLKTDIDSELLIFSSILNQSLKAEGKKELLKHSVRQWYSGLWELKQVGTFATDLQCGTACYHMWDLSAQWDLSQKRGKVKIELKLRGLISFNGL